MLRAGMDGCGFGGLGLRLGVDGRRRAEVSDGVRRACVEVLVWMGFGRDAKYHARREIVGWGYML